MVQQMRHTVSLKHLAPEQVGATTREVTEVTSFQMGYWLQENQERRRTAMENHFVDGLTMNSGDGCTRRDLRVLKIDKILIPLEFIDFPLHLVHQAAALVHRFNSEIVLSASDLISVISRGTPSKNLRLPFAYVRYTCY
jgi:hypothetical protein